MPDPLSGEGEGIVADRALPASTSTIPGLSVDELDLDVDHGARYESDEVRRRYAVSREAAEAFTIAWVGAHQELAGEPRVCLALPWLDRSGHVLAHQFVVTDLEECSGYDDLIAQMRAIAADAAGSEHPLMERTRLSGGHFFTLAVSALVFQHPIRDGIKGLPFWLIAFDRIEGSAEPSALSPVAVYPTGNEGGLIEVVEYRSGPGDGDELLFSHHGGRVVERSEIRHTADPAMAFERFRAMVMSRYGDDPGARLDRHLRLWSTYVHARRGR